MNGIMPALIGKKVSIANTIAQKSGYAIRITKINGNALTITPDVNNYRINLSITGTVPQNNDYSNMTVTDMKIG